MTDLSRFSISIEPSLLERLESLVRKHKYANRSEFVRDLLRERLVEEEWKGNEEVVGTITLVYDHETRELSKKLTRLQHHHHDLVLASTHVHLDKHMCAEMVLTKGPAAEIQKMADMLRQQKGVLHASLSLSSTGRELG
ncbi:MAG: nickel-responsive transcriptional regulator NikR [Verrucomicrobia bacterium]|jgi:CopG family transcriptional regulator, nickel-responsive regulator|nr:nickel-responsive transcriptional regulator NikR [Verrucomicrobiota bacterium]